MVKTLAASNPQTETTSIMKTSALLLPPCDYLKSILTYCPSSGILSWKADSGRVRAGSPAGWLNKADGYRYVEIRGTPFLAHRIAWKLTHGVDPIHEIDHRNGVRSENAFTNLREATHSENMWNCGQRTSNTSGIKGVSWDKARSKWLAQIQLHGRKKHLGRFPSKEEATEAYRKASLNLHGAFSR